MKKRLLEIKKELKLFKDAEFALDRADKMTPDIKKVFDELKDKLIKEKEQIERDLM